MPSDFSKLMHLPLVTSVTPAKPCSSAEAPAEGPWVSQWERQEHSLQGESTALPVVCTPGPGIFRWLMCWAPRFAQQLPSSARTESEFGGGGVCFTMAPACFTLGSQQSLGAQWSLQSPLPLWKVWFSPHPVRWVQLASS